MRSIVAGCPKYSRAGTSRKASGPVVHLHGVICLLPRVKELIAPVLADAIVPPILVPVHMIIDRMIGSRVLDEWERKIFERPERVFRSRYHMDDRSPSSARGFRDALVHNLESSVVPLGHHPDTRLPPALCINQRLVETPPRTIWVVCHRNAKTLVVTMDIIVWGFGARKVARRGFLPVTSASRAGIVEVVLAIRPEYMGAEGRYAIPELGSPAGKATSWKVYGPSR